MVLLTLNMLLTILQALCDIEVVDGKYHDDNPPHESQAAPESAAPTPESQIVAATQAAEGTTVPQSSPPSSEDISEIPKSKHASLATPAVRGLLKTHNVDILDLTGTGKEEIAAHAGMKDRISFMSTS